MKWYAKVYGQMNADSVRPRSLSIQALANIVLKSTIQFSISLQQRIFLNIFEKSFTEPNKIAFLTSHSFNMKEKKKCSYILADFYNRYYLDGNKSIVNCKETQNLQCSRRTRLSFIIKRNVQSTFYFQLKTVR